jgi:hypothetical protein
MGRYLIMYSCPASISLTEWFLQARHVATMGTINTACGIPRVAWQKHIMYVLAAVRVRAGSIWVSKASGFQCLLFDHHTSGLGKFRLSGGSD